jgi:hypothetical protein
LRKFKSGAAAPVDEKFPLRIDPVLSADAWPPGTCAGRCQFWCQFVLEVGALSCLAVR